MTEGRRERGSLELGVYLLLLQQTICGPGGAKLWCSEGVDPIQKAEGAAHRAGGCGEGAGDLVAGCEMSLLG